MAEYKDVELLKKQIADFKRAVNSVEPMNSDYLTGYISALSVIEGVIAEQPIADVAKVVRCKDCKHKFVEYDGTFTCNIFSNCYGLPYRINLDDFCSRGERRE